MWNHTFHVLRQSAFVGFYVIKVCNVIDGRCDCLDYWATINKFSVIGFLCLWNWKEVQKNVEKLKLWFNLLMTVSIAKTLILARDSRRVCFLRGIFHGIDLLELSLVLSHSDGAIMMSPVMSSLATLVGIVRAKLLRCGRESVLVELKPDMEVKQTLLLLLCHTSSLSLFSAQTKIYLIC